MDSVFLYDVDSCEYKKTSTEWPGPFYYNLFFKIHMGKA
jgi:hypothetical protein